jgi:surfeit locus 1 family protein
MRSTKGISQATQRKTPFVLFVFLGFVLLGLVALGSWQVKRLIWKQDLIARVEARVNAAPVPLPTNWAALNADNSEYLRVTVTGTYQYQHQVLTKALTAMDDGFWVMTPLVTDQGQTVYINRGFIPTDKRAQFLNALPANTGPVSVTGLLRLPEPKPFLRSNEPEAQRWYSRDIATMGQRAGLHDVAPFFIDAQKGLSDGALPIAGLTQISFPNNHLIYAITWYGLAVLLVWMLFYVRRKSSSESIH